VMRKVGYDAITMGNRETHPMLSVVRGKLAGAPCPIPQIRSPRPDL
jgi:hypothetical protein